MTDQPGFFRRFPRALWNAITRVRVALSNILFILILLLIFVALRDGAPAPLPEKAALLVNPIGTVVEQKSYVDPVNLLFSEPLPSEREVLLRDLLDAIETAAHDASISSLVLDLKQLYGVGISKSEEIATALAGFRNTGKPVIAVADFYGQEQYFLASQADTVILHPLGAVMLEGYGSYQWYFRDALEKLAINMHVFRAGEHKSVAEPLLRNDMSESEREISLQWLAPMWQHFVDGVEHNRKLPAGTVNSYIEGFVSLLDAGDGDTARIALEQGLVDRLEGRREANDYLVSVVGAQDEEGNFQAVPFEHYLDHKRPLPQDWEQSDRIAVVTASGMILDGRAPAGSIGGDSLADLLEETSNDERVKAIVLRVDSGGGSAFASEIIRQRLLGARALGKPVVVSMGSVAASGGYWIAASADEIWATPTTVTGSIGVFAAFPTVENLLEKLGIHSDGVGTTTVAGGGRGERPMSPHTAATVQASVESIYSRFVGLVAEGRQMTAEAVDEVAQGRVWGAIDAQRIGLVDHLGGLQEAISAAGKIANLDVYQVHYVEQPLSTEEMFFKQFLGLVSSWGLRSAPPGWQNILSSWSAPLLGRLDNLARMNDPSGMYAQCSACVAP